MRKRDCLVVAHRGGANLAPENTLAAFKNALQLGIQVMELDVHPTRDGHLVVIHDDTLERTTTGMGSVQQHTLEELRQFDAGSWFDARFQKERIPTLRSILQLARENQAGLVIEVKHPEDGPRYPHIEEQLLEELREENMIERVVVISFDEETIRNLDPSLKRGFLFYQPTDLTQLGKLDWIGPYLGLVDRPMVEQAHALGMKVNVWTVNEEQEMRRMLDIGADAVTTDSPDVCLKVGGFRSRV